MDEYVIGFVDETEVWRELTFRGVSEIVAKALANGLDQVFAHVTLTGSQPTPIPIGDGPGVGS